MRPRIAKSTAHAVLAIGLIVVTGVPAAAAPKAAGSSAVRLARVREVLDAEREKLKMPGLAVAVVEGDRVTLLDGFGLRDVERNLPVDGHTVFPIGSCTKSFTALAAVISQEDGKLSLDDHPRRHFPWFKMVDLEADALVTLRDMLSHRTGLPAYADLAAEPNVLTRHEYIRATMGARPAVKFRDKLRYSNAMIVAVGEIVAKVQRTTWERVIEERILEPLGMTSSAASTVDLPRFPNRATGYSAPDANGKRHPVPPPASLGALAPAGSIISTASDMARWIRFMLAEGELEGRRIISAAGIREVTKPHMLVRDSWWYGLGLVTYDWNGHRVVEHNGGSEGICAIVSLMPDRKLGFVLLGNIGPRPSLMQITTAGKLLWPILTGEKEPAPRPSTATPAAQPDPDLDTTQLPPLTELLSKMTAAAGGERNLRGHATMELHAHKRYAHHGVESELRVRWAMPNQREDHETWSAAGRKIAELRLFFDGRTGGQETTFGQDAMYSGEELDRARGNAELNWFLDPEAAGLRTRVLGRSKLGDESVYLLETTSKDSVVTRYAVSARTFLVMKRSTGRSEAVYSDFRNVGGRVWPFRTAITDELGETDVTVRDVRFDLPLASSTFGPRAGAIKATSNAR